MKYLSLVVLLAVSQNIAYPYISKFLTIDLNSKEYQLITNPGSFPLKEGALIADGVKSNIAQSCLDRISNFEESLGEGDGLPDNPIELSKLVFNRMHSLLMIKSAGQTAAGTAASLELLIKKGLYSPLSAAILFNSLMEDQGFSCKTILTETNIYSMVAIGGVNVLADAADPAGFDIGPEGIDRGPGLTEYASKTGLIAFIYADLSERAYALKQYENAYQLALRSLAINQDLKSVNERLTEEINGYSLYLSDVKRDYPLSLSVLEEGVLYFPLKDSYLSNYFYVLNKYLNVLTGSGSYERAVAEMDRYITISGKNDAYEKEFYNRILTKVINQENDFKKAYEIGRKALAEKSRYDNIRVLMITGYNLLSRKMIDNWRKYPEGEEEMLRWYKLMKNDYFDTILENYYSQVAMKYCSYGSTERGLEIISNGMAMFPQSKVLSGDLTAIADSAAANAYACFRKGYFESGIEISRQGMKADPTNAAIMSNLLAGYQKYARQVYLQRSYYKTVAVCQEGLELFPADQMLTSYLEAAKKRIK
ncbi:MAG: hypothetical protein ABSG94_00445 [Brevinematales bacterium]